MTRAKPELVLVGVTVLWASTFVVTKDVLRGQAPIAFLAVRFGIAALVMLLITWRRFPVDRRTLIDGLVLGLLNSTGLLVQVFGQLYTTASKSAFVTSLNTPLTPLLAWALYRMRPRPAQLHAVVIASVGLVLLTYPPQGARWNPGDLLTLACAVLYALTIVQIARRTPGKDVWALTTIQIGTAAVLFAGCLLLARTVLADLPLMRAEALPYAVSPRIVGETLYMALVCTVVTFAGQTWAMSKMSATHAAVIFALEPVFTTVMAIGWQGEAEWPGARGAFGALMVMVAVVVSEVRWAR